MKVKIIAFGIAKEILNGAEQHFDLPEQSTISQLKNQLIEQYPDFNKLNSLKFAVNEDYQSDEYIINEKDEVVIIPPVSGG